MEPKFKVGQKVRVVDDRGGHVVGDIFSISVIHNDCRNLFYNFEGVAQGLYECRLEADTQESLVANATPKSVVEDIGSAATSKHYNAQAIQPIELMEMSFSRDEFKGFLKGNILKYSMRAGSKSGESVFKDTVKAKQYKMWLDLAQRGIKIDPRVHIVIKEK